MDEKLEKRSHIPESQQALSPDLELQIEDLLRKKNRKIPMSFLTSQLMTKFQFREPHNQFHAILLEFDSRNLESKFLQIDNNKRTNLISPSSCFFVKFYQFQSVVP
jgi:hypothetical protein